MTTSKLRDAYDEVPPEWRHLVAGSDEEATQFDEVAAPVEPARSQEAPALSRAESERMNAAIDHHTLCHQFGIEPDPSMALPTTEIDPGARGPWGMGKLISRTPADEFAAQLQKSAREIVERAQRGDPEAKAFVEKSKATGRTLRKSGLTGLTFLQRMAAHADEFCEDVRIREFIKAMARGDRRGMRAAVKPIAYDIVEQELESDAL